LYHTPPSQLLNLKRRLRKEGVFDPEYICWCFDSAVEWAGNFIENKLSKADDPQKELELLLKPTETMEVNGKEKLMLMRMQLNMALGKAPLEGMRGDVGD